jgi:hypothetical protein
MTYFIKFKDWLLMRIKLKNDHSTNSPIIIPREITAIDLRFEDVKEG